jgi:hypothetical protein
VSAIGGLNDNNQIVNFSLLASAPTTIAAHSIDIVTNGVNTIIYANASGAVENLGSIDMKIHLANVTNIHSNDFILHS